MKILSMQVSLPQTINYHGQLVATGIFKKPVPGPLSLRTYNLDGDGQADLTVHGGRNKAVYAYGFDAYAWWQTNRPQDEYPFGSFGENLTVDTLPEDQIFVDDIYEIGTALVQVTEPRFPCYKLGAKFNDPRILKTFMQSKRSGVYFCVLREGLLNVGDSLKLISREADQRSINDVFLNKKKRSESGGAQE